MTGSDWATLLASIAALASAIYAIWRGRKTIIVENRDVGADTASKYEKLARDAAERWAEIDTKNAALEKRLDLVESNLKSVSEYVSVLLHGIELLMHQIKANGMVPVWSPPPAPKLRDTGELKAKT